MGYVRHEPSSHLLLWAPKLYIYWELRSCTTLALGGANLSRQASTADLGKHMIEKGDESMSLLGSTVRDCCLNLRYVFILWVVGL